MSATSAEEAEAAAPRHVIVMGVSGSGKTTLAEALARRTGWVFAEADDFHPPANIAKMEAGTPLTDDDRAPWLDSLNGWMSERDAAGESTVITCSALRRPYRDRLREGLGHLGFLHLDGPTELIRERMQGRSGHFMPPRLLESQLATLDPLEADELGIVLDIRESPEELVERALDWIEPADRG